MTSAEIAAALADGQATQHLDADEMALAWSR